MHSDPPFLAACLMDTGGASAAELCAAAILRIRAHNKENEATPNHVRADTHCKPILGWLWLAATQKLPSFAAVPSIDLQVLASYLVLHQRAIHTASTIIDTPRTIHASNALSQLATNVHKQTTILQAISTSQE